jgi:hypothetical protein
MALAVTRYLVVFLKRPGGQAQFSAALALQAAQAKSVPSDNPDYRPTQ